MDTRGSGCGVIRIASSMGGRNYCMRELSGHALVAEADALFRNERIPHPLLDLGLLCKPFDSRLTGAVDGRPRRRHAQWPAEGNHASRRAWNAQNASIRAANAPEARCPHTRPKMLIDAFTCVLVYKLAEVPCQQATVLKPTVENQKDTKEKRGKPQYHYQQ